MAEGARTLPNGQSKRVYKITCPYCFQEFSDNEVHFRFRFLAEQKSAISSRRSGNYDDEEEDDDEIVVNRNAAKGDQKYLDFWKPFGKTSEATEKGLEPENIPVYDPKKDKKFFVSGKDPFRRINNDPDGMVYGALYSDGKTEVTERVCPNCHNPLMGSYGLYPTKFISVIGVTAAGKTVFLSQLCKIMKDAMARYGLTAQPTSPYAEYYMEENFVGMGRPLPDSTPAERFLQPLCYDITYTVKNAMGIKEKTVNTIVFYDIAGENCTDKVGMDKFGKFIEHSDGIMLLIPPQQFNANKESDGAFYSSMPTAVLDTIYNTFQYRKSIKDVPLAVCISQGDRVAQTILGSKLTDISFMQNNGTAVSKFNAEDYNAIHEKIMAFLSVNQVTLCQQIKDQYDNYNYFLVSALGTGVSDEDHTPIGPTVPLRIMEPVTWLLTKFNFLEASDFVYQPEDWECPICGKRYHNSPDTLYCKDHLVNADGYWKCNYCSTDTEIKLNPDGQKWCTCKRDRFGKKKGLLDGIKEAVGKDK